MHHGVLKERDAHGWMQMIKVCIMIREQNTATATATASGLGWIEYTTAVHAPHRHLLVEGGYCVVAAMDTNLNSRHLSQ